MQSESTKRSSSVVRDDRAQLNQETEMAGLARTKRQRNQVRNTKPAIKRLDLLQ